MSHTVNDPPVTTDVTATDRLSAVWQKWFIDFFAKFEENTSGAAKAWVNFSGGVDVTIGSSFNVSSITYHAAGDYTITFINAFADANYCIIGTCREIALSTLGAVVVVDPDNDPTTTTVRVNTHNTSGTQEAKAMIYVACFGNQ